MFILDTIIPDFFPVNSGSEVWGKKLEFQKGNTYRIIAPSGSGKTSLVHFLFGLNFKYSGHISYSGVEFSASTKSEIPAFRANSLSCVFQDLRLIPSISLIDNLQLKTSLSDFDEQEVWDLLRFFDLEEKSKRLVNQLSQGERQRVSIIRSLCQNFEFLILDEPFSHLNEDWIEKSWELIKNKARRQEAGILLTSLDGNENWKFDTDLGL